ncbi:MAG: PilZ domain-containing protein [Candidatus Omnitrophica bacterium]|nr:PilZ domain-containing protein [Candidatus Omnitrophota bacterium]
MGAEIPASSGPLIERRRLPRLSVSAPVQFRNVLKPNEPFSGCLTQDLSASGVRLTSSAFLPKEERLVLLLHLPGVLKAVRMIGRVAWLRRHRFAESYDCGLQFIEITPEDKGLIAGVVERGVFTRPAPAIS